jgi:hypothetical protein
MLRLDKKRAFGFGIKLYPNNNKTMNLPTLALNNAYVENFLKKKKDFSKIIFANQTSIELGTVIAEKNRP